jgi:hypothetical protein
MKMKIIFFIFSREKQKAYRNNRLLDKRLRDALAAAEESQRLANSYKEQVRK